MMFRQVLERGFWNRSLEQLLEELSSVVNSNRPSTLVHTVNLDHLILAQQDVSFKNVMQCAEYLTLDGAPLVWAARLAGMDVRERVTGADLAVQMCIRGKEYGFRVYLLGAAPGVAVEAKKQMEFLSDKADIVGCYSPSRSELFDPDAVKNIINNINASGANVLLVAFGAPVQEKWLFNNLCDLQTSVNIGVGAAIDFMANRVSRAPKLFRSLGMEWFYRLVTEPRRMFVRYILHDLPMVPSLFYSALVFRMSRTR